MNLSIISKSLLIALPMLALGACSSNTSSDAQSTETNSGTTAEQTETATKADDNSTVQTGSVEPIELSPEEQLAEKYSKAILEYTIQFDFDKSTIKPEFTKILDAHAKFLVDNADKSLTIEGHADERGTPEYNIALGERRAKSVATYLENMGVDAKQITVVSYGEEKPANPAHSEEAWAENRRAVLVY